MRATGACVMGHSYAHLWNMPITMFRFFTVYGPCIKPGAEQILRRTHPQGMTAERRNVLWW